MPAWPATLPNPTRDAYGLEPQSGTARASGEDGKAPPRQRYTNTPTQLPQRWIFTEAEFAVFEAWFRQVALDGAAWVDMPVANGQGINTLSARFAGPYKAVMISRAYEVTARLEVRDLLPQEAV